jgi:uncharacterized protein
MKELRASSYMNEVDIGDGTSLLFNGLTLCIDLVPTEYVRLLSDGRDLSFLLPEEKQHLLDRGHLTPLTPRRELEEFKKLVQVILEKRTKIDAKRKTGSLCFILTYDCNLACSYCYQHSIAKKSDTPTMTAEFVDKFFSQYFAQLFPKRPKKLSITLFGGEPLLSTNREALERILAYAKKRPSIELLVATNATTLGSMADLIGPGRGQIRNVQVTLDGDRELHDKNRVSAVGKPTFDTTIAAIRQLIKLKARVSLRVHIHHEKLESAATLVAFLEKEGLLDHPQVAVYFSPINTFSSDQYSPAQSEMFGQIFQEVSSKTNRPPSNLTFMDKFLAMQTEKVIPKVKFCGTGRDNFYVVDPLGDIYGCYEEAGHKDRRIGSCSGDKVTFRRLKETYSKRHLLNLPECLRCSAALFCGGGCPCEARLQNGSIFESFCHQNKAFIGQTLKAYYLLRRQAPEK